MTSPDLPQLLAQVHERLVEIADNVRYIYRELPALEIPAIVRGEIEAHCDTFGMALDAAGVESHRLDCQMGLYDMVSKRPQKAPAEEVRATIRRIVFDILVPQTTAMNTLVCRLKDLSAGDDAMKTPYVLVMESATNILHACGGLRQDIEGVWRCRQAEAPL